MSATTVPAIPAPTDDNLRDVARAVKGVLDVREGLLGDPLDANVTFRALQEGGVIAVSTIKRGQGTGTLVVTPAVDDSYDPTKDLTPPPAPQGFAATGLFAAIKLDWLLPAIPNYAYTEIWRHTEDVLGNAVRIGSTPNQMYLDYVGNSQTYYYWARFVTQANVTGPYNSTSGTKANSADDPELLLSLLTGEITASQLFKGLGDRIDLIDAGATIAGSVNNRIKTVNDIATLKNRTYVAAAEPTTQAFTLVAGDLWIDSDDSNKLYRWNGSAWVAVTDARIGSLVTDLQTEVTSRTDGDLAETRKTEAIYAAAFAGTGNGYKIFVQATEPTATQIGDIWSWVDPTTGDVTFKRWSGLEWVDSAANKRAATYKGALETAPLEGLVIGDLYFDTSTNDKKVYVWNGSTWKAAASRIPEVAAFVYEESLARVTADDALAQRVSTVSANKTRTYYQDDAPAGTTALPLVVGDLWFDTNDNNKVYRWSGAAWQAASDAGIALVDARVTNVETAKIGYCTTGYCTINGSVSQLNKKAECEAAGGVWTPVATDHIDRKSCELAGNTWNVGLPIATAVKQVSVTDGTTTASLEQRFTAQKTTNNSLLAQYTVKVDVGGHVAGFGLAAEGTAAGTTTSSFGVRADKFFIAPASFPSTVAPPTPYKGMVWVDTSVTPKVTKYWNGTAWSLTPTTLPFVVSNTTQTINGVTVPAGVYIDTGYIADATITKAQISSLYADRIEAGFTRSVDIESAKFSGSEFYIGGTATYEYGDTQRPAQKTGIASVTSPNIALKATGAEFEVGYFKIRNTTQSGSTLVTPFEVVNSTVRISTALIGNGTITNAKIGAEISSLDYVAGTSGWAIKKGSVASDGTVTAGTAEFPAASIRGLLTAAQIDTRGLTIKDAEGNVILSAGTVTTLTNNAADGVKAWAKFSGNTGTLPSGNVDFNFAGSSSKGGNATNTDSVGTQTAVVVASATSNFNKRNDRKTTTPAAPTILTDGTAVDHVLNTDGAADVSFEWGFTASPDPALADAYDIDGFLVYVRQGAADSAYTFGTTPSEEVVYTVPADKRAFIMYGVPADKYYTFGVRAYRIVDQDVAAGGIVQSAITKASGQGENPYQPSAAVAFAGNVSGTVNSVAGSTLTTAATNFNGRNDRNATAVVEPALANATGTLDHVINTDGSADISIEWTWSGTESDIDGFIIFVHDSGTTAPTAQRVINGAANASETVYYLTPQRRAFILAGVAADHWYTFGIRAYRIVDPDISAAGVLNSAVIQPLVNATETTFGAYRPASNVAFAGNVSGTVNSVAAATVTAGAADGSAAKTAIDSATTGLATRLSKSANDTLGAVLTVDTTKVAGLRVGDLVWDATGARTSGKGVALTPSGIVGHNGTAVTFSVSAATGDASFAGTLAANTVKTANIEGAAVSAGYAVAGSAVALACSVSVIVPAGTSSVVVLGYCGPPYLATSGVGDAAYNYTAIPVGTVALQYTNNPDGSAVSPLLPFTDVTTQTQHVITSVNAPVAGTWTVRLTRDFASGPMNLAVTVNKR